MMMGFGARYGVLSFFEPQPVDPSKPDPRAVAEMEAYDLLPAEARAAVGDSPNDVGLADKLQGIRQRGAPRVVLERLRERKLMPYQVGEGGILAEIIADELEKAS
jgi:phosphoglycolate phosphatase-like HAD superfamily hydrolase